MSINSKLQYTLCKVGETDVVEWKGRLSSEESLELIPFVCKDFVVANGDNLDITLKTVAGKVDKIIDFLQKQENEKDVCVNEEKAKIIADLRREFDAIVDQTNRINFRLTNSVDWNLDLLQNQVKGLEEKLQKFDDVTGAMLEDIRKQVSNQVDQVDLLSKRVSEVSTNYADNYFEFCKLETKFKELQSSVDSSNASIEKHEERLEFLGIDWNNICCNVSKLHTTVGELSNRIEEQVQRVDQIENEIADEYHKAKDEINTSLEQTEKRIMEKTQVLIDTHSEINQSRYDKLTDIARVHSNRIDDSNSRLSTVCNDLESRFQAAVTSVCDEMRTRMEKKVAEADSIVKEMRTAYQSKLNEMEFRLHALEENNRKLDESVELIKLASDVIDSTTLRVGYLESQRREDQSALGELRSQLEASKTDIKDIQEMLPKMIMEF